MSWKSPNLISKDHPLYRWLVWGTVTLLANFGVLSATVGFIANSTIRGALMLSSDDQLWLSISFIMMLAIVLPIAIWSSERFGYKITFFVGALAFAFGSFLDGTATSFATFMGSRMIAGAGAGTLFPVSLAIIGKVFPPRQMGLAFALYAGIAFGCGSLLGYVLGGYITQFFGWQWGFLLCFFSSLPLILFATLLIDESEPRPSYHFDLLGFIPFAMFIVGMLLTLANAKAAWNTQGWHSTFIYITEAVCVTGFIIFLILMLLPRKDPLFQLRLFKTKTFSIGNGTIFFMGMVLYANYTIPTDFLNEILLYDRWTTGWYLCSTGFSLTGGSILSAYISRRISPRISTIFGLGLILFGCFYGMGVTINSSHFQILLSCNLKMLGAGFTLGPATAYAMSEIPKELVGPASLINTFCRQYGGTIGTLLSQIITTDRVVFHNDRFGSQVDITSPRFQEIVRNISSHLTLNTGATVQEAHEKAVYLIQRNIEAQSNTAAFNDAFFVLGVIVSCAFAFLLLELFLEMWKKLKNKDQATVTSLHR